MMRESYCRNFVRSSIVLMLFLSFFKISAQEGIGVLTDNYLPVNQSRLNPSSMVDQIPWMSINTVGVHAYVRNNFAFARDYRVQFKDEPKLAFETPNRFGKAFIALEALGPSATIAIKNQAFGFHTAVRSNLSMNRIPAAIAKVITDEGIENLEDGTYEMRNGRLKTMSWMEVGVSYGRTVYQRNNVMIDGGISVKRLIGIQQSSLTIRRASVDVFNEAGTLTELDGQYSYAEPAFGAGSGWGVTVGGVYKKMKDYTDHYVPQSRSHGCKWLGYKYKIGVSLVDLGYIRFKNEARTASLPDSVSVDNLEDFDEDVLAQEEDKFTAALPTAMSVQIDYNLQEHIYLNTILVQRLSLRNSFGVERSNLLTFSPRYESGLFSVSLPLSLANFEVPQLGVYLRVGPIAIGTDHLSPFLIKHDVKAASFYFFINLPLQNPACKLDKTKPLGKWFCPVWQ